MLAAVLWFLLQGGAILGLVISPAEGRRSGNA